MNIKYIVVATIILAFAVSLHAETRTWTGTAGNDWFDAGNWEDGDSQPGVPQGDDVVIVNAGADILLADETAVLASFTMNGGDLTFSNWTTRLRATTVTITGGELKPFGDFTSAGPSNRVWIVCTDFSLGAAGSINADGCGYSQGHGDGRGQDNSTDLMGGGGGYGGHGEGRLTGLMGRPYGSASNPVLPGSPGGDASGTDGGPGGGVVLIEASGTVTVDGTISSNGSDGGSAHQRSSGGGSGGSVWITANAFGGSGGEIIAKGGTAIWSTDVGKRQGGVGGGGRIAVYYDSLVDTPDVSFNVDHGAPHDEAKFNERDWALPSWPWTAHVGSLHFTDTTLLDGLLTASGGVLDNSIIGVFSFSSTNAWTPALNTVTNTKIGIPTDNVWTISANVTIDGGKLSVGQYGELICEGNLALVNDAELLLYSGITNGISADYGVLLDVAGWLDVGAGCAVLPFSHSEDGGAPLIRSGNLRVQAGGEINADGRGFDLDHGPGMGTAGSGAVGTGGGGHGGAGGDGTTAGGGIYGVTNAPMLPGSPSGNVTDREHTRGGAGGGLVRIETGEVELDGTISANGIQGSSSHSRDAGGGSGGAVFIICDKFTKELSALVSANGADGLGAMTDAGGGGGGRIALWQNIPASSRLAYLAGHGGGVVRILASDFEVEGGEPGGASAEAGDPGTAYVFIVRGSIFLFR